MAHTYKENTSIKSKALVKKIAKVTKSIVVSNKHTKRMATKLKNVTLLAIGGLEQREIYSLSTFYPTIHDYYYQCKDVRASDPLVSILLPTYNTPEIYLRECIESIIIQSYSNWELCIADDASTDPNVVKTIKEYQKVDKRIKLIERSNNGHISEASNSALSIAKGKFVALMDHDDVLWPNALYENIQIIRSNKKVDFIYSDEDKIDGTGKIHSYPFLKPDFSPEFLESCNYITHFSCIRTDVIKKVGGFRKGYEGAQDWDLFIRISEITNNIVHIPKLLYSWRIHEASTASNTDAKPYVYESQKKLLEDHNKRTGHKGIVETGIITQHRTINYSVDNKIHTTVVIFFSSLDNIEVLISSINGHYAGLAVDYIIVFKKNVSDKNWDEILELLPDATKLVGDNYSGSDKYQLLAKKIKSDYIIYMDDTVSVISDGWAKRLVADCQLDGVAIVAPVLLDETTTIIKSAGVGVGYGPSGFSDMLEGTPFDDPHYTRGLYAKSRRNVSVVNPAMFIAKRSAIEAALSNVRFEEICIDLIHKGY